MREPEVACSSPFSALLLYIDSIMLFDQNMWLRIKKHYFNWWKCFII